LTRAEFRELEENQELRERRGRVWTVHVGAHGRGDGLSHVVLRAGDYVRHVDERFADDYALVEEGTVAELPDGRLRSVRLVGP
jgi:hypothetical protein